MRRLLLVGGLVLLLSHGTQAQNLAGKLADGRTSSSQSRPSSADLLRTFRTIQIVTGTWLAKPEMYEGALQKHREFDEWELSLVRGGGAEVVVKIDHQPGWFYYQYSMVHTPSRLVLASGNVTAWDGKVACNMVADRIVERIKKVRPLPEKDEKKKKDK